MALKESEPGCRRVSTLISGATAPSMRNLPRTLVSSVVWGSEETPLLMSSRFLPERNSSSRRFSLWRCRSRLLPSLPSICQRKTDSVLTWKKEGDVNVSNRHLQRCMWRNSWKTLPELVTFRPKRKVSIYHRQMTYISTSDCDRTSQKAPISSIPETQTCHPRGRTQASLLDLPGKSPRIQRVNLAPQNVSCPFLWLLIWFEKVWFHLPGASPVPEKCQLLLAGDWLPHREMKLSCPVIHSASSSMRENSSQPYNLH